MVETSNLIDILDRQQRELVESHPVSLNKHGRGGPPGDIEARLAVLEESVRGLRADTARIEAGLVKVQEKIDSIRTTDFRLIFAAIITVALGLAGIMAKGFGWFG